MKSLLFAALLAAFALVAWVASPAFGDERIHVEKTLPAESPVSVVLVEQCGSAIGLYATMPDGRLLAFDMSTPVPFGEQVAWAERSQGRIITVEARCVISPGEFTPT